MNYLTMHFGLRRRGRLQEGETVLVHGAAGGIGTASIQLAKAWGARVLAVVSTPEKGEVAKAAGAHDVVLADGFKDAVKELTGGRGVDLVVDPVGGDRMTDSLRSLAREGRLLVIGFTEGEIPTVKVNRLLLANISVVGVGWGAFWTARPRPTCRSSGPTCCRCSRPARCSRRSAACARWSEAADALLEIDERRARARCSCACADRARLTRHLVRDRRGRPRGGRCVCRRSAPGVVLGRGEVVAGAAEQDGVGGVLGPPSAQGTTWWGTQRWAGRPQPARSQR